MNRRWRTMFSLEATFLVTLPGEVLSLTEDDLGEIFTTFTVTSCTSFLSALCSSFFDSSFFQSFPVSSFFPRFFLSFFDNAFVQSPVAVIETRLMLYRHSRFRKMSCEIKSNQIITWYNPSTNKQLSKIQQHGMHWWLVSLVTKKNKFCSSNSLVPVTKIWVIYKLCSFSITGLDGKNN